MGPVCRSHMRQRPPGRSRFAGLISFPCSCQWPFSLWCPAKLCKVSLDQQTFLCVMHAMLKAAHASVHTQPFIACCVTTSRCLAAGAILLVILAAVDAAFSGDWSRIGAISTDSELWLQSSLKILAAWHLSMGVAAYVIAAQNGRPVFPATLKVCDKIKCCICHCSVVFSGMPQRTVSSAS